MSQYYETGTRTFETGAALKAHRLVKLVAGVLQYAVAADGDVAIGVTTRETFAAGEKVAVRLLSAQGTFKLQVNNAIAVGAKVYTAAAGKGSATSTSATKLGIAFEASTADDDIIEVMPILTAA